LIAFIDEELDDATLLEKAFANVVTYPNPFIDKIMIRNLAESIQSVRILDLSGREVLRVEEYALERNSTQ